MEFSFQPKGVCSRQMDITLKDGKIEKLKIIGGCNGNLQGISKLVEGRDAAEVIALLKGIPCGMKRTSCPDQLAIALEQALK